MSERLIDLDPVAKRRAVSVAIVRVIAVSAAVFGAYYLVPVSTYGGDHVLLALFASIYLSLSATEANELLGDARPHRFSVLHHNSFRYGRFRRCPAGDRRRPATHERSDATRPGSPQRHRVAGDRHRSPPNRGRVAAKRETVIP
jgi:hypothetical protein